MHAVRDHERLVDQAAAVADGSSRDSLPSVIRVRIPDTVDSGISSTSAIWAPVIRNLRSAAIARTRGSGVLVG